MEQQPTNRIRELLECLDLLRAQIQKIEKELQALGYEAPPLLNSDVFERLIETLKQREQEDRFFYALARIDFRDEHYTFERAIDGDTIVVKPPQALREWMKDVHIRLYGLETPELWEDRGGEYRTYLENLCSDSPSGSLMVVWERERLGTNYQGYPLSSFERGIGHVFIQVSENEYYYVNGLMHLLRYSTLTRNSKSLLRGRNRIGEMCGQLFWCGACMTELKEPKKSCSSTFDKLKSMRPPVCLLSYPRLPGLDPRDPSFAERVGGTLMESQRRGCPFELILREHWSRFKPEMCEQRVSPFDIPLSLLSMWAAEKHREKKEKGRKGKKGDATLLEQRPIKV